MNILSQVEEKKTRKYNIVHRSKQANVLDDATRGLSQRTLEKKYDISKSTLQHWIARKEELKGKVDPNTVEFLESSSGQAFLHTLILGAFLIFHENGNCGIPALSRFFELTKLSSFVGTSISALQKVEKSMDKQIINFGSEETNRLSEDMPHKLITGALDENFIMDSMTLILMDPVSGFILAEELAKKRDTETWHKVTQAAVRGLRVQILQLVGDEAGGLRKLATDRLQVIKGSDLFHIQQDITKGLTCHLARTIKQVKKTLEDLEKEKLKVLDQLAKKLKQAGGIENLSKRGISAAKRILEIEKEEKACQKSIDTAQARYDEAKETRKAITDCYHPFNLETGEKQAPEKVKEVLEKSYTALEAIAKEVNSTEKQDQKLQKSKSLIDSMVSVLIFFFSYLSATMVSLEIDGSSAKALFEKIVSLEYLKLCLPKAKGKKNKEKIRKTIEKIEGELEEDPLWIQINPATQTVWLRKALDCAQVFQRSSSCVEGRNGQLSLKFHAFRRVNSVKLKVLTILHNFFIRRADNTTAAERFFEQKQRDLFEWLLSNVSLPARPREKHTRGSGKSQKKQAA